MCGKYTIVKKFRVNLVGKVNGTIFNARKKLKWWRRVNILCGGYDGWRRKWYLRCFRFFCLFIYIYIYIHAVLRGLCVWLKCERSCLFSFLRFERISDFLFCGVFCDGYIYIYIFFFFFLNLFYFILFFHHTTCESTCDTLSSSAANQGDNTVSLAQGGYRSCVITLVGVLKGFQIFYLVGCFVMVIYIYVL